MRLEYPQLDAGRDRAVWRLSNPFLDATADHRKSSGSVSRTPCADQCRAISFRYSDLASLLMRRVTGMSIGSIMQASLLSYERGLTCWSYLMRNSSSVRRSIGTPKCSLLYPRAHSADTSPSCAATSLHHWRCSRFC